MWQPAESIGRKMAEWRWRAAALPKQSAHIVVADTMTVREVVNDSHATGSHSQHSYRSAGKEPMALVSDLLQNEHWMVAQSGERQQRSGQGCA